MFWTYSQNNSGGSYTYPAHYVIIEADTALEADLRAVNEAGLYFDGVQKGLDCECCGDRWHPATDPYDGFVNEDGTEVPMIYDQELGDMTDKERREVAFFPK